MSSILSCILPIFRSQGEKPKHQHCNHSGLMVSTYQGGGVRVDLTLGQLFALPALGGRKAFDLHAFSGYKNPNVGSGCVLIEQKNVLEIYFCYNILGFCLFSGLKKPVGVSYDTTRAYKWQFRVKTHPKPPFFFKRQTRPPAPV